MNKNLIDALHTDHAATDRADKMSLYAWLIGSWKMDAVIPIDETAHTGKVKSISAGCWRVVPFRMFGSCRIFFMEQRCEYMTR